MTLQYCSDLHLEFPENLRYLEMNPLRPSGDVLILAGDIVPFGLLPLHRWFFEKVSQQFAQVYWVPGNHEYYHTDLSLREGTIHEAILENVFLVNNVAVNYGDIRLVFSTLWTHISPRHQFQIRQGLSDFHVIRYKDRRLSTDDFNRQHAMAIEFLENELKNPHPKTVVVTHHVPTLMHYPEKYLGSVLNEAFAVELHDFIESSGAKAWIFGHHHFSPPAFVIGQTQLLTNQLGYVQLGEHTSFKGDMGFAI
jgi:predicted phosphohydrolase